jgi:hypothetical protein
VGLDAIIPGGVEESLPILHQGNINLAMSDPFIPTDLLNLFAVIAEGYIVTHEINLGNDG